MKLNKIKSKSFLDLFWSFSDNLLQQVINFVVGIILARLLLPEEFGLVGIVTVFIAIASVFVDGGFSAALINKNNTEKKDYDTIFITNILISIFLYCVLFFSSGLIADFFGNPEVKPLLRLAGLNIVLLSFGAIHRTIIIKKLNFKLITVISLIAVLISALCAIYMAYAGFGVYSLVYRILIGQFITLILFWILNKWRPYWHFSVKSFKELFGYGANLMFSNLLNKLHSNIYYLLIGKYFSPAQLGYYTRANTFKDLASNNISSTINRVSFSTLSKITDREARFQKFLFYQNVNYLLTSFSMLFLFFCAEEIVLILLTEKWTESIYILKILSLSGVFISLYSLNLDYLAVLRHTRLYLKIELFGKLLIIPIVLVGIIWGFNGFLYTIVAHSILMYGIAVYYADQKDKGIGKKQFFLVIKFVMTFFILYLFGYFQLDFSNIFVGGVLKTLIVITIFSLVHFHHFKMR